MRSSHPPAFSTAVALDVPPPPGWRRDRGPLGIVYRRRHDDVAVVVMLEGDVFTMSVSRVGRPPSDADVQAALAAFAPGAREVFITPGAAHGNGRHVTHVDGVLPANDQR
jgi:hypothetical protein